ncbi:hypothetical protein ACLVWU_00540 [Bdellovibrio sp. HCB290]|uniref:hypothetical protein n=1 Tax=Bdellovibrio sp. HCB290 TaxID=3394356 RepID=UPI0039B5F7E6
MISSNVLRKFLIVFAVLGFAACAENHEDSGFEGPVPPIDNPEIIEYAQGAIKGRQWKYLQGRANIFKRNNKSFLEIRLWDERFDNPCAVAVGSKYQVRMYVPFDKGSWRIDPLDPFSLIPTIIFSDYSAGGKSKVNLIADEGAASVNILEKGGVSGVVRARFNSEEVERTQVYGRFSVPLCTTLFGSD